ncbi:GNAT family N-acetyltransferase [Streptomyces sp. ISL-43]|uniref:GNAT family N-acetyltransferase n=1 Tax=Streptomyces sp. ISL-43 TaxID=2819183 RepID=UPI001BE91B87|nr:GNAT family N-acetyltransferase [Streptomyces sp. ISL-43]MBT2448863.1 GNAT family N-acetyltransferase [Streptomyces sp. ISL-43]
MTIMHSQDIDTAVSLTARALRDVAHLDWSAPAAGLEWSCHDTAVHVAEDFTAYAAQLTVRAADGYVPLEIRAEEGTGPAGIIEMIEASGGFLSAAVALAGPGARAWHPYGRAGADGFAAMGVVETLLHTHDILGGLGVHDWEPDPALPERVLDRLFPHVPREAGGPDAWRNLLWATGRGELPGLARQTAWRWYAEPVAAERVLLCDISPMAAADLLAGGTGGFAWAEDGPGDGTRRAAGSVVRAREEGTYRPGWGPYAIIRASDRRAIGGMGFHGAPDADGRAEVGYDLVPSARGNGYATDALKALSAWAFGQPGLTLLAATTDEDNAPSQAVLRRTGFTEAGTGEGLVRYVLRGSGA